MREYSVSNYHHWEFEYCGMYCFAGVRSHHDVCRPDGKTDNDFMRCRNVKYAFEVRAYRDSHKVCDHDDIGLSWDQYDSILAELVCKGKNAAGVLLFEILDEVANGSV